MQFLTFDQAKIQPYVSEYKYRVTTVAVMLVFTVLTTVAASIGTYRAWDEGALIGVFIAGWLVFWFGLFALFLRYMLRARLQPANWLVRMQVEGMLVKYRSYLNYQLPPDDPVVVFIAFSEIEWFRQHRIDRNIPGSTREDDTPQRHRYVELKLRDRDMLKQLEDRVAFERQRLPDRKKHWYGSGRVLSRHYPVQVSTDGLIRIEWGAYPQIRHFLRDLGEHVTNRHAVESRLDYGEISSLPNKQQEDMLLELIATGNRIGAVRTVRKLYGWDMTRSVQFVEELAQGKKEAGR